MSRFLVTGAAGFIGFHLCRRLLDLGHVVTGYDGMTNYYDPSLKRARVERLECEPGFTMIEGMLEDRSVLERAMRSAAPEYIVHFAAQAGVRYSLEEPLTYIRSNLIGSWHLLELARAFPPAHLLLASTSSVYGANRKVPFEETDRADQPLSLYAATKVGMEAMAHSHSHLFDIPTTVFRFFTVYGPWGRPDMALFKFADAIEKGLPIDVYGHGRMRRDFTYVDDLVDSIVRLVPQAPSRPDPTGDEDEGSTSPSAPYRVVNIGGGQPVQLMDFITTLERCLGKRAKLTMLDMQPGDVPQTFADPALLRALTGTAPTTPIEEGVRAFVDWYHAYYRTTGESARAA